jgi:RNA polymerase sigma-70 factor (ECF subfamily)
MTEPPGNDASQAYLDYLVRLAQAGSKEAFAALFDYYRSGIEWHLASLVRSPEDRDELALETFFKAWKELPRLRNVSSFKPWLYRIATNLAYDYGRHQKSQQRIQSVSLDECDKLDSPGNFEEDIIKDELLKQALKEVPWKYRMCLLLEIDGKLTRHEIAEIVGIHENSVGTYISYGRQCLREAYKSLQQEGDTAKERRSV